jgi:uncharacterized membrane protein
MNVSWPALLVIFGTLIAIVLVVFWHPQRSRTKTSIPADRLPTSTVFRDDDRYWSGGVFYNNPDDPAMFVPKRFGLGWTLNFGHPQSKRFIITVLVMMLVLLLLPLVVALLGGGSIHSTGCHTFGCQP